MLEVMILFSFIHFNLLRCIEEQMNVTHNTLISSIFTHVLLILCEYLLDSAISSLKRSKINSWKFLFKKVCCRSQVFNDIRVLFVLIWFSEEEFEWECRSFTHFYQIIMSLFNSAMKTILDDHRFRIWKWSTAWSVRWDAVRSTSWWKVEFWKNASQVLKLVNLD